MIFCARATRGRRLPSLDARSGRSFSPHPWRENEQAWRDHRWSFAAAVLDGFLSIRKDTLSLCHTCVLVRDGARLDEVDLHHSTLHGTDLSAVSGLTKTQLDTAFVDEQTKLPQNSPAQHHARQQRRKRADDLYSKSIPGKVLRTVALIQMIDGHLAIRVGPLSSDLRKRLHYPIQAHSGSFRPSLARRLEEANFDWVGWSELELSRIGSPICIFGTPQFAVPRTAHPAV